MATLFEAIKGVFFFVSIVIGIFFLRGQYLFSDETFLLTGKIIMPGYLLLVGVIIGYIISTLWLVKTGETDREVANKIYVKSFVIGLVIGLILAMIYIFFG